VTAIDAPPGQGLGGRPTGEFPARPGPRRLAGIAASWACVCAAITIPLARRGGADPASLVVGALTCIAVTAVGLAVRRARIAVDPDGVRWGWASLGFRMTRARLVRAEVYTDGIALVSRTGPWFLAARDWDRFDAMVRAVVRAGLPVAENAGRAPFRARVQAYGRFLDGLLVVAVLGATVLAVVALAA
jgi:hypothetical protein